jgi:hypothetical protein
MIVLLGQETEFIEAQNKAFFKEFYLKVDFNKLVFKYFFYE